MPYQTVPARPDVTRSPAGDGRGNMGRFLTAVIAAVKSDTTICPRTATRTTNQRLNAWKSAEIPAKSGAIAAAFVES